jgi:hypothetical protein
MKACFQKGIGKNKKTMRSMVVVFYLQDWSPGKGDPGLPGETFPAAPQMTVIQLVTVLY